MTPVEERIDHEEAKRIAEEGVEWCRDFKEGMFSPAPTQDGWTVEMHGLVESHAKLSAFVLALLTEHSAREQTERDLHRLEQQLLAVRDMHDVEDIRLALATKEPPCQ